jgi:hypothetical protein
MAMSPEEKFYRQLSNAISDIRMENYTLARYITRGPVGVNIRFGDVVRAYIEMSKIRYEHGDWVSEQERLHLREMAALDKVLAHNHAAKS